MEENKIPKHESGPEPRATKPIPTFYSNAARIQHSPLEFLIDFGIIAPEQKGKVNLSSRIVMSPQHIKALFKAIGDNIKMYEAQYGKINWPPGVDDIDGYFKQFGM